MIKKKDIHFALLLSVFFPLLFPPIIHASNDAPIIGDFEAPKTVYANKYFLLNATINSARDTSQFVNATVEISHGIILKWINSTDTFSIYSDPNNYCTIDPRGSFKTKLNSTAYKLSWKIKLTWSYPAGPVSILANNTKIFDNQGKSGTSIQGSLFTFEPNLIIYLARQGIATDGLVLFLATDENSGTALKDVSGYANDATLKPNATHGPSWTGGKINSGLSFDGQDDYVEVPSSSSLNFGAGQDFTVELWLKAEKADQWASFIQKEVYDPAGEKRIGWSLAWRINGIELNHMADGAACLYEKVLIRGIGTDWHHYAFVFDRDSFLTAYMDGTVKAKLDISTVSGDLSNARNLEIAHNPWGYGNNYFNGVIDEVRIYNRALTAEEIESNYFADRGIYHPSSILSFKGWLYYEGTGEPPEDTNGITARVNLGIFLKGTSITFYSGGLFNVTLVAEPNDGNYSYTVYASTPAGNSVQNKTVNIVVVEIYKVEIASLSKEDNWLSCTLHGLYSHNKSIIWIAQLRLYNQSRVLIYSDSMTLPLKGGDDFYLSFGLPTLTEGEYTAELQIINPSTGYKGPIRTLTFEIVASSDLNLSHHWMDILIIVVGIIGILALGIWAWSREFD